MKSAFVSRRRCCVLLSFALLASLTAAVRADWQRDDTTLAWKNAAGIVWKFSFDPKAGKPFFNPVTVAAGPSFTNFKPADHPWHYGLWFSWKYINHVNYWEEDRGTGKAQGATRWTPPQIATHADGSATVRLDLTYTPPSGGAALTETRDLEISAPAADGSYTIDWHARFTVGAAPIVLDRTAMPGEPKGQVNGGYAGLGLRMAGAPLTFAALSTSGPLAQFEHDRARPFAPAVAFNFADAVTPAQGIAILSDPANAGENAPWYVINSAQMRFVCAAILAPKPLAYPAGAHFELRYRIAVRASAWTPDTLQAAHAAWSHDAVSSATQAR